MAAPVDDVAQLRSESGQIGNLALDFGQMSARDEIDRAAIASPLVGETEQRPDLFDAEAQIARAPHETQPVQMLRPITAVVAGRASRRGYEADALVVANRLDFDPCRLGERADREHLLLHRLDPVVATGSI